ncbi:MAG TPA: DUF368 domain-containing protein [Clostridia bacterium]|nr:DUF368 domain-containing protein [Clostridia bacterium]
MQGHSIQRVLAGAVIGIGAVLPGVSGGVMAVSMGLYESMLSAVSHFFADVRGNFRFLAPLAIGACLGILAIAKALTWLVSHTQTQLVVLFAGLVLGGMPALWFQANGDLKLASGRRWVSRLFSLVAGLALTWTVTLLERLFSGGATLETLTGPQAFLSGAIYAFGTIIPGISSSFLLLYLGMYEPLMAAVAGLNVPVLACAAAGFGAMALLLIRAVEACFKRFPRIAYNMVMGFVLGSILLIWSWPAFFADAIAC